MEIQDNGKKVISKLIKSNFKLKLMLILKIIANIYLGMLIVNDIKMVHELLIMNCKIPFFW